jgi:hypothetical protein
MKLFLCIASILLALISAPVNAFSFEAWNDPYYGGRSDEIATKGHKQLG